jgi:hypothetical protein
MTRWVSVVAAFVVGAVTTLGACAPSVDVDVTGNRPAEPTETTTATGSGEETAPPDDSDPSTTRPESSTPTTAGPDGSGPSPVDEADIDLVVELWAGYDEAVRAGVDDDVAYIAEHAYPGLELTPERCAVDPAAPGYVPLVAAELDPATIEPDPDWVIRIPRSPVDGETPDGTIYVHDVTVRYEDGSTDTAPAHTTVLDGVAYFFFDCGA